MSTADKLIAKGHRRGKAEGRAEERTKRGAEILLRQLAARFGPLAEAVIARVRTASTDEVDRWAVQVLDAKSLADVIPER